MLYDTVRNYSRKDIYPFHMPGHKRNPSMTPPDLLGLDMTEIPGLDNLRHADGVIRFAQERVADIYGADTCLFSVNGASAGIIAAICACCREGQSLLMPRNSHVSAFSGLVFSGARPVYVYPEETAFGLCGGVKPAHIKHMLESNPECQAVFITSPTYEGFVSDIKTIAGYVHEFGKPLIVDEAHGAHFPFYGVPEPAIRLGADIVITSPHKTLPALSQSALTLVKGVRAHSERLKFFTRACQTSSPSYIIMSMMDYTFQSLSGNIKVFDEYARRLAAARAELTDLAAFRLIGEEITGTAAIYAMDLSKMLFIALGGMSGHELEQRLADEFKVQLEMSGERFALALTGVADTDEGFERLIKGVRSLDALAAEMDIPARRDSYECPPRAESRLTPRQASFASWEQTELHNSIGKISADFISAYPPGVPLLAPGELITNEIAGRLSDIGINRTKTVSVF
ncbi:MAG: PLP-dependent transferase [Clostridiales bacterium]|nr:PLP-dependent transferase [Clostridiales bacterium]